MMANISISVLVPLFCIIQNAMPIDLGSLVAEREEWKNKTICKNEYSSQGSMTLKSCRDSTGKKIRSILYTYSDNRLVSEKSNSNNSNETYSSTFEDDGNGKPSRATTTYGNIAWPVISIIKTGQNGNILEEIKRYSNGVFFDSVKYSYVNGRLDTVRHFTESGPSDKREIYYYDSSSKLERIDYWIGIQLSFVNDQVWLYYKPLRDLIVSTGMEKHGNKGTVPAPKRFVLPNGRRTEERGKSVSLPVFHHE